MENPHFTEEEAGTEVIKVTCPDTNAGDYDVVFLLVKSTFLVGE